MTANGIRLGDDGRLEVVRTAPPEDPERLRRVADLLRRAVGPGAVAVRSWTDDGTTVELVLAYAGRSPVAPLRGDHLVSMATTLAGHVADLHLRGVAHGALATEHILVDGAGTVRLCGITDGQPADDVLAFGLLLRALLDPDDATRAAATILNVADRCCVDDPAARPTMAAVATSLAGAGAPRRAIRATPSPRPPRRRRPIAIAAVVGAIAASGSLAALARDGRAQPRRDVATTTTSTSTTSTTVMRAARVWPATTETLEHDGAAWTFGAPDDLALVGDWDCDGVATPALVQRSGAVWVVDAWPAEAIEARYVTTVAGASAAEVERIGSCDRLVVVTDDGAVRPELRA